MGDNIFITENQKRYHYKVEEIKEVSPKEVSVLEQGDGKILTLMTCTPVGTRLKRLLLEQALLSKFKRCSAHLGFCASAFIYGSSSFWPFHEFCDLPS